jgi:hypothetical protein
VVHHPDAEQKKITLQGCIISLMINSADYIQPPSPDLLLDPNFAKKAISFSGTPYF